MTWPTHPDGSNKTIGEMTAEERGVQVAASRRRRAASDSADVDLEFVDILLDATEATIRASYAPYNTMPAFEEGFRAYTRGTSSQYWNVGVDAQAFDRGMECAMRLGRQGEAGR